MKDRRLPCQTQYLPFPHLIRYVVFVLQLQPRPGGETLDHTLGLSRGELLQESHTFLNLGAAQQILYL